jgi:predicted dehydrogenase
VKIVVVGLGSMGRRRIRLLKKIDCSLEIMGIDNQEIRCQQAEKEFNIETKDSLEDALTLFKPECVIISTSPLTHSEIINKCLKCNCNIFTELNLVSDGYKENIKLANERNKVLFISSTFLYREEIQYIREQVNTYKGILNYNYHVGQYLPDWHPWESINSYFVGDKRTNGCRELFAIELPWLIKTFGPIQNVQVISRKSTNLPIKYKDNYLLLIEHENGSAGTLAVDVMSRKAVRRLEVFGENLYLTWDGTPTTLKQYNITMKQEDAVELYSNVNKQEGYAAFVIENAYENELRAFLDEVNAKKAAKYTFQEDYATIEIINMIEGR